MGDKSRIEWTDAFRTYYKIRHGSDKSRRAQDCCQEGRHNARGVSSARRGRREVVYELQGVALALCLSERWHAVGRSDLELRPIAKRQEQANLHPKASSSPWTVLRARPRWRQCAGKASRELLRGDRTDSSPKLLTLQRLRSRMEARGAAS